MPDLEANISCPNCKRSMRVKVKDMVPGRTKHCPFGCGATLQFSGDDGRKMQRAMDDLERTLKRFGKR